MAFIDKVSEKVSKTGHSAIQKSKEMVDMAKVGGHIAENNSSIRQLQQELGEQYVRLHPDDPEEPLAQLVSAILALEEETAELDEEMQTKRGFVRCPDCGTYVSKDAPFCTNCGAKMGDR